MKSLLTTAFVLLLLVGCVGFARNWFTVSQTGNATNTQSALTVTLNKTRLRDDLRKANQTVQNLTRRGQQDLSTGS